MNETNEQEATIFGIFTPDEVRRLNKEYKEVHLNPSKSLYQVATRVFRHFNIRTFEDIPDNNETSHNLREDIKTAFFNIQACVVTKDGKKIETVEHKRGDFIRDENGDPIPTDDGKDYKKYTKDVIEKKTTLVPVPYFDQANNLPALNYLEKKLSEFEVLPDYDELRGKYLDPNNTSFEKGCDIIRKLTDYYIFENPDLFVERLALLICNAKAKALGFQPKFPVLFSLVGKMGVGKSWLAQMIKQTHDKAFCCHSGVTSYGRLLDGRFNTMMMTRGFLSIDEAQGLDKAQCEKLKTYITSVSVDVEQKGHDIKTCDNLVTFFSTTNESVKDIMGYQPDRRIVEFNILEKKSEIPEEAIVGWLNELWMVMPVVHPNADKIKDDLLKESTTTLCAKMDEIIYDLFKEHPEVITGQNLNQHKFKAAIRSMGGIPYSRVFDWCLNTGILTKIPSGHVRVSKRTLKEFMNKYSEDDACTRGASIEDDLNAIFNTEDK